MKLALLVLSAASTLACTVFTGNPGGTNPNGTSNDIAQYNTLEMKLAANASVLVGNHEASSPTGVGNDVYFIEFPANNPTVPTPHRYDDTANAVIDYGFGIGTTDQQTPYNWSASTTLVTTVDVTGSTPVLHAYNANTPSSEIASLTLPAPIDGAIFQANAVDGNNVYYIDDGSQPVVLDVWVPGQQSTASPVLDFSKVGVDARNVQGFAVSGSRLLLQDEMGGLWNIDIPSQSGSWIGNMTQGTGLSFDATGFLYSTGSSPNAGLYFYEFASQKTIDLAAAIAATSYKLNDTYSTIHHYGSGGALRNGVVYYISEGNGVYSFDMSSQTVTPLLLAPMDDSTEYQSPTILQDGTLVVVGLNTQDPGGSDTLYKVSY